MFKVLKYTSSVSSVEIGVPQGTVLGSALFLLFVNDVLLTLENNVCNTYMYASEITDTLAASTLLWLKKSSKYYQPDPVMVSIQ